MPYKCKIYDDTFRNAGTLYHYTTLDSLKKIIKSRTLLFNRCDKLNDLIEGNRSEVKYFVACFTYHEEESIPMWYMYRRSNNHCIHCNVGVRISVENCDFFTGKVYLDPEKKDIFYTASQLGEVFCGNTIYDDANKYTCPTQGTINPDSGLSVRLTNVPNLGLRGKTAAWKYEQEARFFMLDNELLNVDKIFLELDDSFFEKLKITISPLLSDDLIANAEKEIEKLLGKDRFKHSTLKGCLRFTY